jgi:DNA-binding Lrp family transcriptional regulator
LANSRDEGEENAAKRVMVTKLSALDIEIIRCFHEDARAPLVQVARTLEQPESTIRHRLARLVREGFIH